MLSSDFQECAGDQGKVACGYGAAAKGNTFLKSCGVGPEFIKVAADRWPHKQDTLLPGNCIPMGSLEAMLVEKPDYVFILLWNLKDEIAGQLKGIESWGGRLVTAISRLTVM